MPDKFLSKYGGSFLSAGGDLVSGVVNNLFANSAARKQHEREKELMEIENQYAIDMFNRTNAYNTPSQQMKRFREAGLNPNLIYGNGSAASGNADMPSAPSSGTAAKAEYPGIGNLGASAYQAYGESLQYKSLEANNERTHAETLAIKQNTLNAEVDQLIKLEELWAKARDNYVNDSALPQLIREKRLGVKKLQQDIYESEAREEDFWSRREVNIKTLDVLAENMKLTRAQARKFIADARRAELENENFDVFLKRIVTQTSLNRSDALRSALTFIVEAKLYGERGFNTVVDTPVELVDRLFNMIGPKLKGNDYSFSEVVSLVDDILLEDSVNK